LIVALLVLSSALTFAYGGVSVYIATRLVYSAPVPIKTTPAALTPPLDYREVSFPAREDNLTIRGWLIPGLLPNGRQTLDRTLILIHGTRQNRTDPAMGLLDLSAALVHRGFAVLAFDMRGMGASDPAPISFGQFEQRDVLGAVDFLRAGSLPYPQLDAPRVIGGWGVSMGAATLLLAAAREPAIAAVVSDSAYADIAPLLEREVPKQGDVPGFFTPGAFLAGRALYGVDYYDVRPVDAVARVAPRPLLLIHGSADHYVPPADQDALDAAASAPNDAHVDSWRVAGADHAQAYHTAGQEYVTRVVGFFSDALGPDRSPL
jgi:dipeptidyl aminopeptidase/acylaminoacyl peptidase